MDRSPLVEIRPIGLAACGALAWRFRGQIRVTAIVKASFTFVPEGTMRLDEPDEVFEGEVPWVGDPWSVNGLRPGSPVADATGSLWAAGDDVPYRVLADVVLVGHSRVPSLGGARLAIFREEAIFDRTITVKDTRSPAVPLVWERAFGGPDSPDNPVGTGRVPGSRPPSLIDPEDPRRPAGFGPIPRRWPSRARLLGSADPRIFDAPLIDVPGDLDWAYFQSAPPWQRLEGLNGNEWIVLEGLSAEHPFLPTQLPGAAAAGRVYGLYDDESRAAPLSFRADNLHIDADRGRCSVTYRSSFSLPREEALGRIAILAGVEMPGHEIRWPVVVPLGSRDPVPSLSDLPTEQTYAPTEKLVPVGRQGTMMLEWPDQHLGAAPGQAGLRPQAPDQQPAPPAPPAPRGRLGTMMLEWPDQQPAPPPPPPPLGRQGTVALSWADTPTSIRDLSPLEGTMTWSEEDEKRLAQMKSIPFDSLEDSPLMGTISLTEEQAATPLPMPSPFRIAEPGAPRAEPRGDIPGAPWAKRGSPVVPRPLSAEMTKAFVLDHDSTLPDDLLEEVPPSEVSPPITVVPAPAPAIVAEVAKPAEKSPEAARSWSWATVAEPEREVVKPPPAPRAPPKPVVKNSLYGRFSPGKKK